jgi:hypothetical protein
MCQRNDVGLNFRRYILNAKPLHLATKYAAMRLRIAKTRSGNTRASNRLANLEGTPV